MQCTGAGAAAARCAALLAFLVCSKSAMTYYAQAGQVGHHILSGGLEGSPVTAPLSHAGQDSESTWGIRRWRDRGDENASGTTRAVIASMHGDPAQATIRVGRQDFVCDNDICASLHECWRNDPPARDLVAASPQAVRGVPIIAAGMVHVVIG